jgi:arylsulfate sulfotransferase
MYTKDAGLRTCCSTFDRRHRSGSLGSLVRIGLGTTAILLSAVCPGLTGLAPASAQGAPGKGHVEALDAVHPDTPAITTASLNTLFFDFGNNLVNHSLSQTAVALTNTGKSALLLSPTLSGDPSYIIVKSKSCGSELPAGKTCDIVVRYLPTTPSYPREETATLHLNLGNAEPGVPQTVAIQGTSAVLKPGTVTPTINPQVALYTMTLPFPGRMKVNFGTSKTYGRSTWLQGTDTKNGQVSIYVAGMKANTTYHMAASVELNNMIVASDADHIFTTGALPKQAQFKIAAQTAEGMTPQTGIELTNPVATLQAVDLEGNVIWAYAPPTPSDTYIDGMKMLPNGDMLLVFSPLSNATFGTTPPNSAVFEIREVNLAGDIVREISIDDLNAELTTATCQECAGLVLQTFHHDVTPLPNGHWLVLASVINRLSSTTTPPLTNLPAQSVLGDVIVDLDENLQPVWAWNEFNHLDPNRHPYLFPDWTHTNALIYSPDDGNIVISIRHQNWVIKIDYHNGSGNGDILWKLGEGGTFKLVGGVDPTDWNYAQHGPNFASENTSGVFSLALMDNGDDRIYPKGSKCAPSDNLPASCLYTTIPVFKIDEAGKTATLTFHRKIPGSLYSFFGGNAQELANGDIEYDLCGLNGEQGPMGSSMVREVTKDGKIVWTMTLNGGTFYRAFRIPSLYPGVTW